MAYALPKRITFWEKRVAKTILVVSEAWATRFALPVLLKKAGLVVSAVVLSDLALEMLEEGGFDAVVVTHYPSNKPGQFSAPDLVARMRALPEGELLKIVLVAPPLTPDERRELEKVGATHLVELVNPLEGHGEIVAAIREAPAQK